MNTNSRFPKCLFESVIAMFVVSFYFICRDCCLKLPVVAKKAYLELSTLSACVWVCVCGFLFFLFFPIFLLAWLLTPWKPWLCPSLAFPLLSQLRHLSFRHAHMLCWLLVLYWGLCIFPSLLPTCSVNLLDCPKTSSYDSRLSHIPIEATITQSYKRWQLYNPI